MLIMTVTCREARTGILEETVKRIGSHTVSALDLEHVRTHTSHVLLCALHTHCVHNHGQQVRAKEGVDSSCPWMRGSRDATW